MKLPVYTMKGEKLREVEVSDSVFGVRISPATVHRVVVAAQSNLRLSTAHTKTRGEVRGGGKKPWRQKGTGRARHGSTRSPIWRKGGVVFGPLNIRNYEKNVTNSMRKSALRSVLSDKAGQGRFIVVDQVPIEVQKTKAAAQMVSDIQRGFEVLKPFTGKLTSRKSYQALILTEKYTKSFVRASRNLKMIRVDEARSTNVLDLMKYRVCLIEEKALPLLEKIAKK